MTSSTIIDHKKAIRDYSADVTATFHKYYSGREDKNKNEEDEI